MNWQMTKKKILIHACCGVCALNVIEELKSDYDIALYFFNPNIHPEKEYLKRKKYLINYAKQKSIRVIDDDYNPQIFFQKVKGLENEKEGGKRCAICFEMRLIQTAVIAKENAFDLFTTTLTISPHKNVKTIFDIANLISAQTEIDYLAKNFKKNHGFVKTIKMAKQLDFYLQDYCGCVFSKNERQNQKNNSKMLS